MIKTFNLPIDSMKVVSDNKDFAKVEIYAIAEGETRNQSSFTIKSMEKSLETFFGKPVVGYFSSKNNNFETHNIDLIIDKETNELIRDLTKMDSEYPIGFINEAKDKVEIIEKDGKKWIVFTAHLWKKLYPLPIRKLINSAKKNNGVASKTSAEITVLKSHVFRNNVEIYDIEPRDSEIEIIDEFVFDAMCILGNKRSSRTPENEGIEGSHVKMLSKDNNMMTNFKKVMNFALEKDNSELVDDKTISSTQDKDSILSKIEFNKKKLRLVEKNKNMKFANENMSIKTEVEKCGTYKCIGFNDSDVFVQDKNEKTFKMMSYSIGEEDHITMNADTLRLVTLLAVEDTKEDEEEKEYSCGTMLSELLSADNEEMKCHAEKVETKEKELSEKEVELSEKEAGFTEKEVELSEKETQLSAKEVELSEKETKFAEEKVELESKMMAIEETNKTLAEEVKKFKQEAMAEELESFAKDMELSKEETEVYSAKIAEYSEVEAFAKDLYFSFKEKIKNKPKHFSMGRLIDIPNTVKKSAIEKLKEKK